MVQRGKRRRGAGGTRSSYIRASANSEALTNRYVSSSLQWVAHRRRALRSRYLPGRRNEYVGDSRHSQSGFTHFQRTVLSIVCTLASAWCCSPQTALCFSEVDWLRLRTTSITSCHCSPNLGRANATLLRYVELLVSAHRAEHARPTPTST